MPGAKFAAKTNNKFAVCVGLNTAKKKKNCKLCRVHTHTGEWKFVPPAVHDSVSSGGALLFGINATKTFGVDRHASCVGW